jgi:ABC-2 type transport system permease protein
VIRLVWLNSRVQFQELARYPGFIVPSMALPLVSYVMFGLPQIHHSAPAAAAVLVAFAAFAVLGIVMFEFGVNIAIDRTSPWERYVRSLPSAPSIRFIGRIVVALAFSTVAVLPLLAVALPLTPVHLDAATWARLLVTLIIGAVPLGLLGIMLGYLLSDRAALPVTNVVFLPLAYAGGLFGYSGSDLPGFAARISPWLPTRQWSDLLVKFGLHAQLPLHSVLALAGYGVAFAMVAVSAYRRDETRQYR